MNYKEQLKQLRNDKVKIHFTDGSEVSFRLSKSSFRRHIEKLKHLILLYRGFPKSHMNLRTPKCITEVYNCFRNNKSSLEKYKHKSIETFTIEEIIDCLTIVSYLKSRVKYYDQIGYMSFPREDSGTTAEIFIQNILYRQVKDER